MALKIGKPELNIFKKKKDEKELMPDSAAFGVGGFGVKFEDDDDSDFEVNVRNSDAGIKLLDSKAAEGPWWKRELSHEIATGIALMSVIVFLLAAAYQNNLIPYAFVGTIAYLGLVILGEKSDVRAKYFTAGAIFAALVLAAIFMRQYVGGGIGSIMNMVYDASEAEQAYIYDRFNEDAETELPEMAMTVGVVWASLLFGTIGAVPFAAMRRALGLIVAAAAMIAFAYYGLVPALVCIIIVIVAILLVLARGGMLSTIPVLLLSLLVFGAVVMISPGENYGISRADENIRDRLALRSAYLETDLQTETPEQTPDFQNNEEQIENEEEEFEIHNKLILPLVIAGLVLLAIAAAIYLLYRRYIKRRDANRAGIDSEDLRTAIISMFPYAVKWLGTMNMEVKDKPFAMLVEPLKERVSDQYSNYFKSMYVLWREAAYSDHEMDIEKRTAMKEFLDDTTEMVQRDMGLKDKIVNALKYAL